MADFTTHASSSRGTPKKGVWQRKSGVRRPSMIPTASNGIKSDLWALCKHLPALIGRFSNVGLVHTQTPFSENLALLKEECFNKGQWKKVYSKRIIHIPLCLYFYSKGFVTPKPDVNSIILRKPYTLSHPPGLPPWTLWLLTLWGSWEKQINPGDMAEQSQETCKSSPGHKSPAETCLRTLKRKSCRTEPHGHAFQSLVCKEWAPCKQGCQSGTRVNKDLKTYWDYVLWFHWEGLSFIYLLVLRVILNLHLCKWKTGAGNFNWVSPKGSFCPLYSFPCIFLLKFSPGFTMIRSMNFFSLICLLSKSMKFHWFPHPAQIQPEVETSHRWCFKGNIKVIQGPPICGWHSPGCRHSWSLSPSC